MKRYQTVTLSDVVISANTGADAIKRAPIVPYNSGIRCLRIQDISQRKDISEWGYCKINEKDYEKFVLKKDDILIARTGETIGVNLIIKKNETAVYNNGLIRLIVDKSKCYPKYISYNLGSNYFKSYIDVVGRTTSTQPNIKIDVLMRFKLLLPSLFCQQKISQILSTYDDLIENNNRRIKILEEMAQTIYNEWFIKFRFPGYSKVKMVDSELGKIPEEWEVKQLQDLVDFVRGIEPGTKNYSYKYKKGLVPFLRVGDLGSRNSGLFISQEIAGDKILHEDNIALSLDGTPGIVKIGLYGCYSTGIRKIIAKDKKMRTPFLYLLMLSDTIQNIIKAHSKGTTILHAGEAIKYMKFIRPEESIMHSFHTISEPIMDSILLLTRKNANLNESRNLLLPRLIAGDLDIEKLDIPIEAS